jgi:predicted TIM-barrel fold metal-dependent hydrolase
VLFGTDSPWADQKAEVALLEKSGLTETELAAVFHDNAAKLLGL